MSPLFSTVLYTLVKTTRQTTKEEKRHPNSKEEVKSFLFTDVMIFYVEIPKETMRTNTLILAKVQMESRHTITLSFLYANNERSEKNIQKISFTLAPK